MFRGLQVTLRLSSKSNPVKCAEGQILRSREGNLLKQEIRCMGSLNQRISKKRQVHIKKMEAIAEKNRQKRPVIEIRKGMTINDLSVATNVKAETVIEAAAVLGLETGGTSVLYKLSLIQGIVKKLGLRSKLESNSKSLENALIADIDEYRSEQPSDTSSFPPRPPIITIMGHVDHGKTTLLDSLRNTSIAEQEAGGITQKIGAFSVKVQDNRMITILDTPGHAAFSAMRRRGAQLTDIVVLVVAADDGIMEQTIESIKMAEEAGVPVVVAINKCDKKQARPKEIMQELSEFGLAPEEEGGHTQVVQISAKTGKGIPNLVESILLQAEVMELRADVKARVEGIIVESRQDINLGPVGSVVIQHGTLKKGMWLTAGTAIGRVRNITDENNQKIQLASPGMPVNIMGWKSIPPIGEVMLQVPKEARAKEVSEYRKKLLKLEQSEEDFKKIKEFRQQQKNMYRDVRDKHLFKKEQREILGEKSAEFYNANSGVPELNILVKADVDGSLDAILEVVGTYDHHDVVKLNIIDSSVGPINLGDIDAAKTFQGSIIVFNQITSEETLKSASQNSVEVQTFDVIYHLVDHLKTTLTEMIDQNDTVVVGEASVKKTFTYKVQHGHLNIAGCYVESGKLEADGNFVLIRGEEIVHEGPLASLKLEKTDVNAIESHQECGISFADNSVKPQPGDIIQQITYVRKELSWDPPGF